MEIQINLVWHPEQGEAIQIERELFALLEMIKERGSLQVAARESGLSYRYAWGLMRKWRTLLGQPLAHLARGRGATLTPIGEKLLWGQRRISARVGPELDGLASELSSELHGLIRRDAAPPLRIFASHGLAVPLLRDLLQERSGAAIDLQFRGSLDSLRLFAAGKCDLAGFHLPDGVLGARLAPKFARHLDPATHRLVRVVRRRQGIVTAAGNPLHIGGVADLARGGVRFINRQPGSGTRLIFDLLLEDAGIEPAAVHGYNTEEFTHLAVAAMVASGAADAGFAIEPVAHQFGLHFEPVASEDYWLVARKRELDTLCNGDLLAALRGSAFRDAIAGLQGYDAASAGEVHDVTDYFSPLRETGGRSRRA